MAYKKPQVPLKVDDNYIYPLTTIDQIVRPNGERLSEDEFDKKLDINSVDTESYYKYTDLDLSVTPSSAITHYPIVFRDKNLKSVFELAVQKRTDGVNRTYFIAKNSSGTQNFFYLDVNENGAMSVGVANSLVWRNALDVNVLNFLTNSETSKVFNVSPPRSYVMVFGNANQGDMLSIISIETSGCIVKNFGSKGIQSATYSNGKLTINSNVMPWGRYTIISNGNISLA